MESVRLLHASFKGILSKDGDDSYLHHTGSQAANLKSAREGDQHDCSYHTGKLRVAEKKHDRVAIEVEKKSTRSCQRDIKR